jgi:hypothetical protein
VLAEAAGPQRTGMHGTDAHGHQLCVRVPCLRPHPPAPARPSSSAAHSNQPILNPTLALRSHTHTHTHIVCKVGAYLHELVIVVHNILELGRPHLCAGGSSCACPCRSRRHRRCLCDHVHHGTPSAAKRARARRQGTPGAVGVAAWGRGKCAHACERVGAGEACLGVPPGMRSRVCATRTRPRPASAVSR